MWIFTKDDQYVGYDNNSGGYPYYTDNPMNVKVWYDKNDAIEYRKMFKDEVWQFRKLNGLSFSLPLVGEDV